jgi:hypothetical protein
VLVELGVVEQRYNAVKEVLDRQGTVTEVAERYGVTRQSLQLAPALPGAGDGRPRRSLQATEELPAPHAGPSRDPGNRAPKRASPLGTETPGLRARPQATRPGALSLSIHPRWARSHATYRERCNLLIGMSVFLSCR